MRKVILIIPFDVVMRALACITKIESMLFGRALDMPMHHGDLKDVMLGKPAQIASSTSQVRPEQTHSSSHFIQKWQALDVAWKPISTACNLRNVVAVPKRNVRVFGSIGRMGRECTKQALARDTTVKMCHLCGREIPRALQSMHHLIPKLKGGKTTEDNIVVLHRPCHDMIHAVFTEAELARSYSSIDALLTHPKIAKFAKWIAKRPIDFSDGTASLRKRRKQGRL